jgi:hypothetical protein
MWLHHEGHSAAQAHASAQPAAHAVAQWWTRMRELDATMCVAVIGFSCRCCKVHWSTSRGHLLCLNGVADACVNLTWCGSGGRLLRLPAGSARMAGSDCCAVMMAARLLTLAAASAAVPLAPEASTCMLLAEPAGGGSGDGAAAAAARLDLRAGREQQRA